VRVSQRITYKLCLITYKARSDRMPDYIADFCIRVTDNQLQSTSKNLLQVPRPSTKFVDLSFSVAWPTAINA